jgi:hypothetical protein
MDIIFDCVMVIWLLLLCETSYFLNIKIRKVLLIYWLTHEDVQDSRSVHPMPHTIKKDKQTYQMALLSFLMELYSLDCFSWVTGCNYNWNIKVGVHIFIYWLTKWIRIFVGKSILCHIQLRMINRHTRWHDYHFYCVMVIWMLLLGDNSYWNNKVWEHTFIYWLTKWIWIFVGQSILCHIQLRMINRHTRWHGYHLWWSYGTDTTSPGWQ